MHYRSSRLRLAFHLFFHAILAAGAVYLVSYKLVPAFVRFFSRGFSYF